MPDSVLLLHRSPAFREAIRATVESLADGIQAHAVGEPLTAALESDPPSLAVVDFGTGSKKVDASLEAIHERASGCSVLAVVEPAGASRAVALMGAGVDDYVLAPPQPGDLLARCRRLLRSRGLHRRLELLQTELSRRYGAHRIVCRSSAMQAVYQRVLQLAPTRATVLITGESGAGKELVARSLHYNSDRRDQPFVAMNCGAVPETLIESELFGHERGAFTGAVATVPGKFELAHGGTLFLDEVGSMGAATQVRLLRVLEEGEFMRVGGNRTLRVDVRVLAATNTDLDAQVESREFRRDLLYRLKVATVQVPPLRLRRDDIPPLARTFVKQLCEESRLPPKEISPEAVRALLGHDWPGNVRELKNLLESLVVTVPEQVLEPEHLPDDVRSGGGRPDRGSLSLGMTLREVERRYITDTLRSFDGNRTRTAKALDIGLRTLQRKIKALGIDVPYRG